MELEASLAWGGARRQRAGARLAADHDLDGTAAAQLGEAVVYRVTLDAKHDLGHRCGIGSLPGAGCDAGFHGVAEGLYGLVRDRLSKKAREAQLPRHTSRQDDRLERVPKDDEDQKDPAGDHESRCLTRT